MESKLLDVAEYAIEQPGVSGYLCVDGDGLCISAKGEASESMSGIIHQIATLASKIEEPSRKDTPPVIRVDLERQKIMIQSCESVTTALISQHK